MYDITLFHNFYNVHRINWVCFGIGVAGVAFLLGFRTLKRNFAPKRPWLRYIPEILLLVIIGIATSAIFHFDQPPMNISILGALNSQFPSPM
jgi:MFS superfamily sulfate permease-like transporter